MTKLYVDTNVFLDIIKDRKNIFGVDIATPAAKMFFDAATCKFYILISKLTVEQIYRRCTYDECNTLFNIIKNKIIVVGYDANDRINTKNRSSNFEDAMHIILAEKSNADLIITRNVEHFLQIGTHIEIKKPENLD